MNDDTTLREVLAESYANLAMAPMAITNGSDKFSRTHFMVRAKLRKGLLNGAMSMRPLADDEKLKMVLPQACSYCGATERLSVDHLIPTARGGPNTGENLVWACRRCNSSKGARDMLAWWFATHDAFPPILLLRRYLKIAWGLAEISGLLKNSVRDAEDAPFDITAIPTRYPPPRDLKLWVIPIR